MRQLLRPLLPFHSCGFVCMAVPSLSIIFLCVLLLLSTFPSFLIFLLVVFLSFASMFLSFHDCVGRGWLVGFGILGGEGVQE